VDEHLRGKEKRRLFIWSLLNFEPLRLASFTGFVCAFLSLIVAIGYFIYKLIFGSEFQLGIASLMIVFFFFMAVQLVLIGVIGEYIGAIYTQVKKKRLVIEKER
jgi:membrane protein YdbS with pleckstrin-like domain